jgi:hypothetical protein
MTYRIWLTLLGAISAVLVIPGSALADSLVTKGSPSTTFSQNKQNEPAVAIDPANPSIVVTGANEQMDQPPCNGNDCSFAQGVGTSGVYFSFNSGASWIQPTTYQGWSGRTGKLGPGPIATLPNYYEQGLVSDGDPAVAFGPKPGTNGFTWGNGARLYYANLTANFSTVKKDFTFKGFEAIAASHTDDLTAAASGSNAAWSDPAIVSERRQSQTTFSDKEAIAVDDAATSPDFGDAYICYGQFRSQEKSPNAIPVVIGVSHSTDGGNTWSRPLQISDANQNGLAGNPACAIDTDSHGNVYVVWEDTVKGQSVFKLATSKDGGASFSTPHIVAHVAEIGQFDNVRSISFDGIAGARTGSAASLSIANGAPTGVGAPNTMALGWSDGSDGLNHEHSLVQLSANGGQSWTGPTHVDQSGDRPDFTGIGLSPNGSDLYVVYDAFLTPFRNNTTSTRTFQGVVRHADVSGTTISNKSTLDRHTTGDARASSANALIDEFLGDYNWVAATNSGAVAVYNDASNAAVCPAINAYRASVAAGSPGTAPAPATDCPATFGNTDIFSSVQPDPTP